MADIKLSTEIQDFLNRPSTIKFLDTAREFVVLLELENVGKNEFLKKSHSLLVELYATGHTLDEIPLKYSSSESEFENEKALINKYAGIKDSTPQTVGA